MNAHVHQLHLHTVIVGRRILKFNSHDDCSCQFLTEPVCYFFSSTHSLMTCTDESQIDAFCATL